MAIKQHHFAKKNRKQRIRRFLGERISSRVGIFSRLYNIYLNCIYTLGVYKKIGRRGEGFWTAAQKMLLT